MVSLVLAGASQYFRNTSKPIPAALAAARNRNMQQQEERREERSRVERRRGASAPTGRNKYRDDGAYLSITAEIPP